MKTFSMKPTLSAAILFLLLAGSNAARAGLAGMGNAFVELSANGGATAYDSAVSDQGQTLATISLGQTLYLGGQIQTYPSDYGTTVTMGYQLNGGTWQTINLPYSTGNSSSYDQWDSGALVDIASSLNLGNNSLTIYYTAHNNIDSSSASYNNFGGNFTFNIDVVPEPINLALGGFGGLFAAAGLVRFLARRAAAPSLI